MIITINKESLDKIKANIKKLKNQLKDEIIPDFLRECCYKIQEMANDNLTLLDIGVNVKTDIRFGWNEPVITKNKAVLTNSADKAVYVEFGVGKVGEQHKHENADKTGYQYNKPSPYKGADGYWAFETTDADLDLPQKDVYYQRLGDSLSVMTNGTESTMFVYNAIMDFANKQMAQTIWEETKRKYWG